MYIYICIYIGHILHWFNCLTVVTFKDRWRNHDSNFKNRNSKIYLETEESKPENHVTGMCNLCVGALNGKLIS